MRIDVVAVSGGVDSATLLAQALKSGGEPVAVTVRYGQRHEHRETLAAKQVLDHYGVPWTSRHPLTLPTPSGTALTPLDGVDVPPEAPPDGGTPPTYVPHRNLLILALCAQVGEALALGRPGGPHEVHVHYGAHRDDHGGYPDCRRGFVTAFRGALRAGSRAVMEGHSLDVTAPFLDLTKTDVVSRAVTLGVPLHLTYSCYRGRPRHCGRCPTCAQRADAMAVNGLNLEGRPLCG